MQKDEGRHRCRQVRQERQAKGCQCTHSGRLDTAFPASKLWTKPDKHHPTATGGADVLQSDASPCKTLVHQHDHAGPEDSYGCKLGRSRIRVTGFWIRLDILSNQLCRRSSVVLHKFAKVPWLKLYRDNSVLDSDLRIAAINTNAMAIDEIDSDEEKRSRLRRKKETLEMDDNLEIQGTRGTEGSDARGSRHPVPPPLET